MTTLASDQLHSPASQRRALNLVLAVGITDALLLVVLMYFAFVDRSDAAVSVLGPIHGIGYLILLYLTASGAGAKRWGWWFPGIVLVTGGPLGSIVGDVVLRRRLPDGA
jgi:integral membrane protein